MILLDENFPDDQVPLLKRWHVHCRKIGQDLSHLGYKVPHPDFIAVSPRGSSVMGYDAQERPHHLNAILIERVSPINSSRGRKAGRRN